MTPEALSSLRKKKLWPREGKGLFKPHSLLVFQVPQGHTSLSLQSYLHNGCFSHGCPPQLGWEFL